MKSSESSNGGAVQVEQAGEKRSLRRMQDLQSGKRRKRNGRAHFTLLKRLVSGEQASMDEKNMMELFELARKCMTQAESICASSLAVLG
jgi:hypothetical protein